jgi:hypothetical protein
LGVTSGFSPDFDGDSSDGLWAAGRSSLAARMEKPEPIAHASIATKADNDFNVSRIPVFPTAGV